MAVHPLFCPAFSYHTSQHFRVWWHNTSDTFPNQKEPLPLSGNHTELISASSQATASIHTYKQHLSCCTKPCQLCSTIKVVRNIKGTVRREGAGACWEIQYPTCLLPLLLQLSKLYKLVKPSSNRAYLLSNSGALWFASQLTVSYEPFVSTGEGKQRSEFGRKI